MIIQGIDITIEWHESLGGSPARCRIVEPHKKATIKLAKDALKDVNQEQRLFIILHELGHAYLNTADEEAVDRWAFKQYSQSGASMKNAVYALSTVIDPVGNEEHSSRTIKQFNRAKQYQFLSGKMSWKTFNQIKFKEDEL